MAEQIEFRVPKDFAEFYEEHPKFVRWLASRFKRGASDDEIDDVTQDLLLHLATPLADGGDRISAFNPNHYGDATDTSPDRQRQLLLGYIKRCCQLHYLRNRRREPLNDTTVSIVEHIDEDAPRGNMAHADEFAVDERDQCERRIFCAQFREYVAERKPKLLPIFDALGQHRFIHEVAEELGVPNSTVESQTRQLRRLAARFERIRNV